VWLGLVGTLLCGASSAEQDTLRFSVTDAWSMPFAKFEGDAMVGGFMYDLALSLAAQAKLTPVFVKLPRTRVQQFVQQGEIDARCYASPAWESQPDAYVWSEPIFRMQELVVHRADAPPITDIADLKGKTIGVIFGYRGYAFDHLKDRGELTYSPAPSAEHLMRMLAANRIQYAAINSISYFYFLKQPSFKKVMGNKPFTYTQTTVQCGFPKNGNVPMAQLLAATEALRRSGKVDAILESYR
jgi:polar amino acid transport system substrate-binding protein